MCRLLPVCLNTTFEVEISKALWIVQIIEKNTRLLQCTPGGLNPHPQQNSDTPYNANNASRQYLTYSRYSQIAPLSNILLSKSPALHPSTVGFHLKPLPRRGHSIWRQIRHLHIRKPSSRILRTFSGDSISLRTRDRV